MQKCKLLKQFSKSLNILKKDKIFEDFLFNNRGRKFPNSIPI